MLQLIQLIVQTYILPYPIVKAIDQTSIIVEKVLQSMLCILDGLYRANNISALSSVSMQWAPVFDLRNKRYCLLLQVRARLPKIHFLLVSLTIAYCCSLLSFIGDLLFKDPCIVQFFRASIIR